MKSKVSVFNKICIQECFNTNIYTIFFLLQNNICEFPAHEYKFKRLGLNISDMYILYMMYGEFN